MTATRRIALDTNVINHITDTPGLLDDIRLAITRTGFILVCPKMVRIELEKTNDATRRAALLAVYQALPKEEALDAVGVWGVSGWGECRWSDGGPVHGLTFEATKTTGTGGTGDAVVGLTANAECDVLVTGDGKLNGVLQKQSARCEIWTLQQFTRFIDQCLRETGDQ